jgi:hypothetical protein
MRHRCLFSGSINLVDHRELQLENLKRVLKPHNSTQFFIIGNELFIDVDRWSRDEAEPRAMLSTLRTFGYECASEGAWIVTNDGLVRVGSPGRIDHTEFEMIRNQLHAA